MSMKRLVEFQYFDLEAFLRGKRLVFVKAEVWQDGEQIAGSKITLQIIEDNTAYGRDGTSNFGEQLVVKVRDTAPSAFSKLQPLSTEVVVADVERATLWGEYNNQLAITAVIQVNSVKA